MLENNPRPGESVITAVAHPSPQVSLIVPSLDGFRDGNVPRLIEQIKQQGYASLEVLIVKGVRPNGRARDEGVKQAKGNYFIFIDDDVALGSPRLIESLLAPFLKRPPGNAGITGAAYLLPQDASSFQKKVAAQMPRIECPPVTAITESDMVCHACLAVPTKIYHEVGGESRTLESGTDPDFKARIRKHGYKILLVPEAWVYMPTHSDLKQLCKKAFSAGKNSARIQREHPDLVFESAGTAREGTHPKKNLLGRMLFSLTGMIGALFKGHWIYLLDRIYYSAGYIYGLLT